MAKQPRSTNRTVAKPVYHETRRAKNKNSTRSRLNFRATTADFFESASRHATEFFGTVARRFQANSGYGLQHYNQDGFVHPDGILRLANESLAIAAVQVIEALSQRAAQKGNKAFADQMGEGGDPAEAQQILDGLRKFALDRPKAIREDAKAGIYGSVMKDLGIEDAAEIVPSATSKKTPKKKTSTKKASEEKKADAEAAAAESEATVATA